MLPLWEPTLQEVLQDAGLSLKISTRLKEILPRSCSEKYLNPKP